MGDRPHLTISSELSNMITDIQQSAESYRNALRKYSNEVAPLRPERIKIITDLISTHLYYNATYADITDGKVIKVYGRLRVIRPEHGILVVWTESSDVLIPIDNIISID